MTSSLTVPYDKTSGRLTKSLVVWIISLCVWTVTFDIPASGKNLTFKLEPLNSAPKVPIPVVLPVPTGKNGYWVIYESVVSLIIKNWCKAELLPYPTFAVDLIVVTSDLLHSLFAI